MKLAHAPAKHHHRRLHRPESNAPATVKSSAGSAFAAALESDHRPTKPMKEARFGGLTHAERLVERMGGTGLEPVTPQLVDSERRSQSVSARRNPTTWRRA